MYCYVTWYCVITIIVCFFIEFLDHIIHKVSGNLINVVVMQPVFVSLNHHSSAKIRCVFFPIGDSLDFRVDGKTSFEVPLTNVSNSMFQKNEVTLEFHQSDDAAVSLMELRFHIPTKIDDETDPVSVSNITTWRGTDHDCYRPNIYHT